MNTRSELVALLAGGYSLHRLLAPYLVIGLSTVLLLYLNNEFFIPFASKHVQHLDQKYSKNKTYGDNPAQHLLLADNSTLIYQNFDTATQKFVEVYWIASMDEVWHMQRLDPFMEIPTGEFVDHFKRQKNGMFAYEASMNSLPMRGIQFNTKSLTETTQISDKRSLSELFHALPEASIAEESEKAARSLTIFYYKLALPWLALFAIIGPAPFCVYFSRSVPLFLIFAAGIFGLVSIYLIIDAAIVLGERQVLSPFIAIFAPMGFFFSLFMYRFVRIG